MKLLLHPTVAKRLEHLQNDPKGSHLWHGPASVGKYTAALELAKRLNCSKQGGDDCAICRQIDSSNYPDVLVLHPEDKASIGIEQVRQLDGELGLRPYRVGAQRIIIIDQADKLTPEAQNALLKSIEEPPPTTTFILIAVDTASLLPTVRSRCLELYFPPSPAPIIEASLQAELKLTSPQARHLAQLAEGLPGRAISLALDPVALAAWETREQQATDVLSMSVFDRLLLVRRLYETKADLVIFGQRVVSHIRLEVRQSSATGIEQALTAADHYVEQLSGGATARTALEGLLLER